jgi:hypothetical protein
MPDVCIQHIQGSYVVAIKPTGLQKEVGHLRVLHLRLFLVVTFCITE